MAGRHVRGLIAKPGDQLRFLIDAPLLGFGAARVEPAA
jgi:hypothetical protein